MFLLEDGPVSEGSKHAQNSFKKQGESGKEKGLQRQRRDRTEGLISGPARSKFSEMRWRQGFTELGAYDRGAIGDEKKKAVGGSPVWAIPWRQPC